MIAALIDHAESVVLEVAGDAAGFAFCRRFGRGLVIGPVVAPDARAAQALLAHWIGLQAGTFVRIDVPVNCGLSPWLDGLGLVPCDQVKTMCRGTPPRTKGQQQTFALVNQALG